MNYASALEEAMSELNEELVSKYVKQMMDVGFTFGAIQTALNKGIHNVGMRFEKGDYFIADLIVSGMIYRDALMVLMPMMEKSLLMPIGRVVIGVVDGDIHDIGKDIVVSLLRAEHFEVIDLGVDVPAERFLYAVKTYRPDILLMSGVLNISRESMCKTTELLEKESVRDQIAVLIGGLCAGEFQRSLIGADAWAYDPMETINFCKKVVSAKYGEKGKR